MGMAYSTYTQSFGISNANAKVKIVNAVSGVPAIILATTTGGVINNDGFAVLDSNGDLSVIIDTAQTWHIFVNDLVRPQMQPLYVQTDPDSGNQYAVTWSGERTQVVSLSDTQNTALQGMTSGLVVAPSAIDDTNASSLNGIPMYLASGNTLTVSGLAWPSLTAGLVIQVGQSGSATLAFDGTAVKENASGTSATSVTLAACGSYALYQSPSGAGKFRLTGGAPL